MVVQMYFIMTIIIKNASLGLAASIYSYFKKIKSLISFLYK